MVGYLTPNTPPSDKWFTRRLFIPAQNDWLALVDGALNELTKPYNWQPHGDMSVDDTVAAFDEMYQRYIVNDDEPPAWSTPNELDGEPAQPWYEALEDWIIAGFLAITFTPLAAITYQTTVPKIRVALRTGNIGALFRVLINGVEVWTGDSYAPIIDLIDNVFDNPTPGTACTVRVEHRGVGAGGGERAKLEYVRGDAVAAMVATILRADPGGCGVQWSTDNGGTWNTIDLATCITGLANDAITQAINDGKIAVPGGQPPAGGQPPIGGCKTFHVVLPASQQWLLPWGLGFHDTLQISNVQGTWSDGTPQWYCPEGQTFELGGCFTGGQSHQSGDVLNPGAYHMTLVMKVGDTWYPGPVNLFTQNSGTTPLQVVIQANDGSLSDNYGQLEFDIEYCRAVPVGMCQLWDFAIDNGGFTGYNGTNYTSFGGHPEWGAPNTFEIRATAFTPSQACSFEHISFTSFVYGPRLMRAQLYDLTGGFALRDYNNLNSDGTVYDYPAQLVVGHQYGFTVYCNNAAGVALASIRIEGTGTNPFANGASCA